MKNALGMVGAIIGIVAITIAAFQDDIRAEPPPPPPEVSLKEKAIDAGKNFIADKLGGEKSTAAPVVAKPEKHDAIQITYVALGIVAMVLGVLAWVRKEHTRLSVSTFGLGLIAVAWHYVMLAVFAAILLSLFAGILG